MGSPIDGVGSVTQGLGNSLGNTLNSVTDAATNLLSRAGVPGARDIGGLATAISDVARTDPAAAASLRGQVESQLTPVEQGLLSRTLNTVAPPPPTNAGTAVVNRAVADALAPTPGQQPANTQTQLPNSALAGRAVDPALATSAPRNAPLAPGATPQAPVGVPQTAATLQTATALTRPGGIGVPAAPLAERARLDAAQILAGNPAPGAQGAAVAGQVVEAIGQTVRAPDIMLAAARLREGEILQPLPPDRLTADHQALLEEIGGEQLAWGLQADQWGIAALAEGGFVYGALPGQSAYYTDAATLQAAGDSRAALFESLQVAPHPELGHRPMVGEYELLRELEVPYAIVRANPQLGPGEGVQLVIEDYPQALRLVRVLGLGA